MPAGDNLVIVLDPGHGGENEGLKHRGLIEKDMNLVTANAMRDELMQYENVEVYITNPEKADMSLKERAQYADSVGADILISLHLICPKPIECLVRKSGFRVWDWAIPECILSEMCLWSSLMRWDLHCAESRRA